MDERHYTDEELDHMLEGMRQASKNFYLHAVSIGNHAFIEFCGLMNEYINMCAGTKNAGRDFTLCNRHSGHALVSHDYQAKYLAEKFECIYGTILADEDKRKVFTKEMGWT